MRASCSTWPPLLCNDAEFASDGSEGLNGAVDVAGRMCRRHLGADTRLPLGHDREREADDIDSAGKQARRHLLRQCGIAQHYRDNRVTGASEREAKAGHLLAETRSIGVEAAAQIGTLLDQVEDGQ